jgi:transcription elongation factor Elf1
MVIPSDEPERGIPLHHSSPASRYRNLAFVEHTFMCPYCGEEISMVLDLSVPRQVYIEDCEVCCSPIEISYSAEDDELTSFIAKRLE